MEIHLTSEQEAFIEGAIRMGKFASVDDAFRKAVSLLEQSEVLNNASVQESPIALASERSKFLRQDLAQFLLESPLAGSGIVTERLRDSPREIQF